MKTLLSVWVLGAALIAFSATTAVAASGEADASASRGRRLFLRCGSCHDIRPSTATKIGPNLEGVYGRPAASLSGYAYSPAMKAAKFVWSPEMLDRWLSQPNALVPGTSMAFAGLPEPEDRKALIAFLQAHPEPGAAQRPGP